MKILLAEDFEDNRFFLTMVLESYGYEVISANDGQQAWDILTQREDINLVLSDWVMPNIDGIQLCQLIRRSHRSRYTYIILMTALGEEKAVVRGMEAGADDFLRKPVESEELRVRLNAGQRIIELENTLAEHNQKLQAAYNQIKQDLESAAEMQQDLLPEPKILANFRFDRLFYPCQFIAGDIFNFLNSESIISAFINWMFPDTVYVLRYYLLHYTIGLRMNLFNVDFCCVKWKVNISPFRLSKCCMR